MKFVAQAVAKALKSGMSGAAFLGFTAVFSGAQAAGTSLTVSATLLKHASLKMLSQPQSVVITPQDIARGYVDVPVAAQVMVRSNTLAGYMLMFENQSALVRHTQVTGLGNELQIDTSGGVAQPAAGRGMTSSLLGLGFRFVLSESATLGTHAWPVRISVLPI